ncbi:hypothetical protein AB6A40_004134 [Gnathostoma spinigerum]|uniref:Calponin-homology (CH) domain-containing protein n=1 Tax=Gnathostoma spinigerum TaxID=75299 RepID=A0ABD6ECQ9_9BILA
MLSDSDSSLPDEEQIRTVDERCGDDRTHREPNVKTVRSSSADDAISGTSSYAIELRTFTNWLNHQFGDIGIRIENASKELSDGILLIKLIEILQDRTCTGKIYKDKPSEMQKILNVQMGLDALKEDGVRMANIGAREIVEQDLKHILALVWNIIQRYHIDSRTKMPIQKLLLAWLQAIIPNANILDFSRSWLDGRAFGALIDYCQPGLCPKWNELSRDSAKENCENLIKIAANQLGVPPVLHATDLISANLSEKACITYIAYFARSDGPAHNVTLKSIQQLLPDINITDFDACWRDGYVLKSLIAAVSGRADYPVAEATSMSACIQNIQNGLRAAADLGVTPLVTAEDVYNPNADHYGVMALAASLASLANTQSDVISAECLQYQHVNLDLDFAKDETINLDEVFVEITDSNGKTLDSDLMEINKTRTDRGAIVTLVPHQIGSYKNMGGDHSNVTA